MVAVIGHSGQSECSPIRNMTSEANPYRPPGSVPVFVEDESTSAPRCRFVTRYRLAIWLLAYLYPVWLLGSFYSTWLIAWIQLGHLPRPMLDDPKSIGGIIDIAYFVTGILVMAMPVLTPIGLIASFFCPISTRRTARYALKAALAVLYVALCALVLLTLRTDPGRVVEWWFD